jgi:glycosyltransferase involved in cell wall biosynthesis
VRVLVLTNFYPPHELGGQGKSCKQVVNGLRQRGHEVLVLTSMHGSNNVPREENGISRSLFLEMDLAAWRHGLVFFTSRRRREQTNLERCAALLQRFVPDVVFVWGMWNFPRSLPAFVEAQCPGAVLYRFAEYWPTLPSQHLMYWNEPGRTWYSRLPKRAAALLARALLAREARDISLAFEHAFCVSAATREALVEAGIPVQQARVIRTGLDASPYLTDGDRRRAPSDKGPMRILYAGRLAPQKGIETLIAALRSVIYEQGIRDVSLQIAGAGLPAYESKLQALVRQEELDAYVAFLGSVPAAQMPRLMNSCDVLVVPSIWAEPFPRVALEGMASGLAVIASTAGGTSEIVRDGENGLLFAAEDDDALVKALRRLHGNPALRAQLGRRGRQTVVEEYTLTRMMDQIEALLLEVAGVEHAAPVGAA